jgi:hypothetical protein
MQEHRIWEDTAEAAAVCDPKEAAKRAQRLQAYMIEAADRAGSQLEPGLRKELFEVLALAV